MAAGCAVPGWLVVRLRFDPGVPAMEIAGIWQFFQQGSTSCG